MRLPLRYRTGSSSRPSRHRSATFRTLPVRPFPSMNGWTASKTPCDTAILSSGSIPPSAMYPASSSTMPDTAPPGGGV